MTINGKWDDYEKNDFMETAFPYIKTMEHRIYELSNQRNSRFLTLIWFIIATSGLIIVNWESNKSVKILLIIAIICFVVWRFLYFNLFWVQVRRLSKNVDNFLKYAELKDEDKIQQKWNQILIELKVNSENKNSKKDKILNIIISSLWNLWLLMFIVWLIYFIISL